MSDILVRQVPEHVVEALKRRAAANRRSLQQEVLGILEDAAHGMGTPQEVAEAIRTRLAGSGRSFSDSVPLIREDRDR